MDEFTMMMRLGGLGGGIDAGAVLLFIAIAVVYFLAPVLGYRADRRASIAASLYLFVGYAGLSAFGLVAQFTMLAASGGGFGRNSDLGYALFGISILKVVVLTMVIVMFVVGLQTLRPRAGDYGREEPHPH